MPGTGDGDWRQALVINALRRMRYGATVLCEQRQSIVAAGEAVASAIASGGIVLVCGNGGSAAAAQHFAAEFTGKLALDRHPMPAIALNVDTSAMTAIANDYSYEEIFARQVQAFAGARATLVALSTSGSSRNIDRALRAAEQAGIPSVVLTGESNLLGGDIKIEVPLRETARVQELHDLALHEIAQIAERILLPDLGDDPSADRFPFVLDRDLLTSFADWMKRTRQRLVTTDGVFDLLHEGHLSSLRAARSIGDRLVVLVNPDASTSELKGPGRPVRLLDARIAALERSSLVDHVAVIEDVDPASLLELLRPDVHAKGDEYRGIDLPEAPIVEKHGGRIEYLGALPGVFTTVVIDRMRR